MEEGRTRTYAIHLVLETEGRPHRAGVRSKGEDWARVFVRVSEEKVRQGIHCRLG